MSMRTTHPDVPNHLSMTFPQIPSSEDDGAVAEELADLSDEMIHCWAEWRESAFEVTYAYNRWSAAPATEEAERFAAYVSALDQEEAAAASYAKVLADMERWWREREPTTGR
jgi:hypothetical protein